MYVLIIVHPHIRPWFWFNWRSHTPFPSGLVEVWSPRTGLWWYAGFSRKKCMTCWWTLALIFKWGGAKDGNMKCPWSIIIPHFADVELVKRSGQRVQPTPASCLVTATLWVWQFKTIPNMTRHVLSKNHPLNGSFMIVSPIYSYVYDSICVLYYIILYCIILYYMILYYIVLYYIILYDIILYCIILYYIILYDIILYCVILYCVILYCVILYYIILYYITLYYIILYYTILYDTI